MWYFSWMLGTSMAVLLAVVNALWFEAQSARDHDDEK
ncbi:cytochrome bd-I oxidase subunit CydX [Undibacterium sp. CY21W]|nr:cytochrome bd-I oxidase subunit CydX [Undibacterium sp. CY21W]MBC3928371.1 cytochrome bd-I oxidase subunit CydX [Undibacterium sp. CY21W]